MLRVLRAFVVVTSFMLILMVTWAETELTNNQFLQAWLAERGLWWFAYLPLLVGLVGGSTLVYALFQWPTIIETVPLVSRGNNGTIAPAQQEVRLTDKGQVFESHEDYSPDLDKSRVPNVTLPTNSQGPLIGGLTGPGNSAVAVVASTTTKGEPVAAPVPAAGKPESEITIPSDSPLVKYALKVDSQYKFVEPPPGTPALQRVRGVLLRRKNTDDGGLVDSDKDVR